MFLHLLNVFHPRNYILLSKTSEHNAEYFLPLAQYPQYFKIKNVKHFIGDIVCFYDRKITNFALIKILHCSIPKT